MKKYLITAAILGLSLLFTACGTKKDEPAVKRSEAVTENNSDPQDDTNQAASGKLEIYTSFYPLYDFALKVGGDRVDVTNMVPAGTEPHNWEPATTDILSLEKGDILIYNGVDMEHWIDRVTSSLENKNLVLVKASDGLTLLEGGEEGEEQESEEESGYDAHVWLSIKNARIEMENIKNALVIADPDNGDYYEDNYGKYAARFDELDKKFDSELSLLDNKDIVVAHKAFAYLCADYGLNQVAIEGLEADSKPDAKRIGEIVEFAKNKKIKTIFYEELVSPKVAQTIASEVGAVTDVLNPLEGLTQEQLNDGEDYLSVMEENLEALLQALK